MSTPVKFVGARKFKHTCHIRGFHFKKSYFDKNFQSDFFGPTYDGTIYLFKETGGKYKLLNLDEDHVALFPVEIMRE